MNFFEKFNRLKTKKQISNSIPTMFFIGVFALLLVISGTSYAYLTDEQGGTLINTVSAGTLTLTLDNESTAIVLDRAVPQLDEDAIENNTEYTFTLSNTGTVLTHYEVVINSICSTSSSYTIDGTSITPDLCMPNEYVKVGVSKNGGEYVINTFEDGSIILDAGEIGTGNSISYTIKLWLDVDTPNDYSALDAEGNDRNVIFVANLNITGEQRDNYTPEYCFNYRNAEYALVDTITEEMTNSCQTTFIDEWQWYTSETIGDFCTGGVDTYGYTLLDYVNSTSLAPVEIDQLLEIGIIEVTEQYDETLIINYLCYEGNWYGYETITDVVIPRTLGGTLVTAITDGTEGHYSSYGAFYQKNITSVILPDTIITIGNGSFYYNEITSLVIPNSVTTIGNDAFRWNYITSLDLSSNTNLTTISDSAFEGNLIEGKITIPDSVTSLGEYAFAYNKIDEVDIGSGITTIVRRTFYDNDITILNISSSVTEIGEYAFAYNEIEELIIPDSVTTIGLEAFEVNKITNLVIPDTVTSLGDSAFNNNMLPDDQAYIYARTDSDSDGVAEIDTTILISYGGANKNPTIPTTITTIKANAFRYGQIETVTIPDNVTTIGSSAFQYNNLKYVVIGENSNLTSLGSLAFSSSRGVTNVNGIKEYVNNPNLTTIYNNSSTALPWIRAVNGTSSSTTKFITGTVASTTSGPTTYNKVLVTTGTP